MLSYCRMRILLGSFLSFNIPHIYREHNTVVDRFLKEGLNVIEGLLHFVEFVDNSKSSEGTLKAFQE